MFAETPIDGDFTHIACHKGLPVWAAGRADGSIHVYGRTDSEKHQQPKATIHKDSIPCILSWHPQKRLLAASWKSGLVGVWSEVEDVFREGVSHRSPISCLEWSPNGARLITADEEGEVVVWKVDMRGKLASVCQYRLKGSVTGCYFRKLYNKPDSRPMTEAFSFYLTTSNGTVVYADDMGHCTEAGSFTGRVLSFKMHTNKDMVSVITDSLVLAQYSIGMDGRMNLENEQKIGSIGHRDFKKLKIVWISDSVLAMVSGSPSIRLLDIFNEESTLLTVDSKEDSFLSHLTYCPITNVIAAGTDSGRFYLWRLQMSLEGGESGSRTWQIWTSISASAPIESVVFGMGGTGIIMRLKNGVKVYMEQKCTFAFQRGLSAIQASPNTIKIFKNGKHLDVEVDENAKALALGGNVLLVCNSGTVQVFEVMEDLSTSRLQSTIKTSASVCAFDNQSVIAASEQKVDIYNPNGTLKNSITMGSEDGTVKYMCSSGGVLGVTTTKNLTKVYDISRREPRFLTMKNFTTTLKAMKVNSSGSMIAHIAATEKDELCNMIQIYSIEKDTVLNFDFNDYHGYPISLSWDSTDPRILVCETSSMEVFTFFVSAEYGIILHDRYLKRYDTDILIGVSMPHYYFMAGSVIPTIFQKVSIDFSDIEEADPSIVAAVTEFSFQVDVGNLDNAVKECGQWSKALEIASAFDRINLRTTYVKFGRYLLDIGDRAGAIAAFEKASSVSHEKPQSLFMNEFECKKYCQESQDKSLKKWWAQYEETRGNFAEAAKFYQDAEDSLSMVRLNCYNGKISQAIDVCNSSENAAAAYFIARHYEKEGKIADAVEFYGKAKCYPQAIRLAKENNLINQLINFALQGTPDAMLDVASYLESSGQNLDKAISLYHRAGQLSKAVNLCFQLQEFHILDDIAASLGPDADTQLLLKCAKFFMDHGNFERAVHLLSHAKRYREALELCMRNNIKVSEDLADKLGGSTEESEIDAERLCQVAEVCLQQRSYHLACKKFSQAGEKTKAMKALLKSGDTERIIFFANVSGPKQKDIYIMAANFLQTLDWRNNPTIMKAIITFYTKTVLYGTNQARAYESLASFYEACSHVEIDEYQSYDKALGALREAVKCYTKCKDSSNAEEKLKVVSERIHHIETFVSARALAKTDPPEMFRICDRLLQEYDIERAVRTGDIFALMIESHYANGNLAKAKDLLHLMQTRVSASNLDYYLEPSILRSLMGDAYHQEPQTRSIHGSNDNDIAEDIVEHDDRSSGSDSESR
ncbi:hypothetical protein HDV05_004510 [Chytridiales sp. JEL 0842]|nr:hypothetical protein HDV05_004510 [Chytridiales sp. JEL 0842]